MRIVTLLAALLVMSAPSVMQAAETTGRMVFDVYRGDSRIGTHRFDFRRTGNEGIEVDIAIDLKVGFGPITLYRYRHRNETVWLDGRLQRMDARTYDDGDKYFVEARAVDEGLQVISSDVGTYTAQADTLPSTYWMRETVAQTRLVNTQNGKMARIEVVEEATDNLATPISVPPSRQYRLTGDVSLSLWYDSGERLAKLSFEKGGEQVTYKLVERSGFVPSSVHLPDERVQG
ncbi:DUF6134 family protein [Ferruginivarius sediminum]|uniref:DUF3108 domain-containing protein n=1 Tax=Ferruginivarius sediminum TaxID=2661937 RepID=A0A369TBJ5_9PROT|nr:DUF6134 family protein [Ferruginivarius sediminum]RDD62679.1 hypothetical protein DRB17_05825 [Ferruginivarius sediminum]